MSLGTKQNRTFLNIKDGRIIKKTPQGDESFDYVAGNLAQISIREMEFKGEKIPYWYFTLQDPNGGEVYILSVYYSSGVAKSIINSLASEENLGLIRIEVYQSGDFTKAKVYNNEKKLSWKYTELPPVEEVRIGDKLIKDDSKRMDFIKEMAREINERINYTLI